MDAVRDVILENLKAETLERGLHRPDLREDVDAVAVLFDHPLDAADLPFDPVKTLDQRSFVVPMGQTDASFVRTLSKHLSRSEFETTKTLENAIAAAAMMGLRSPATASGIAATL